MERLRRGRQGRHLNWKLTIDGLTVRWDELTLAEVADVEQAAGADWHHIAPRRNVTHARAVLSVVAGRLGNTAEKLAAQVRPSDFATADDDRPEMYEDGVPSGGRTTDGFVIALYRRGFTPAQARNEFTWRDLLMIAESSYTGD